MECNVDFFDDNCQTIYQRLDTGNSNPLQARVGDKISFPRQEGINDADLKIHGISSTFQREKLKHVDYLIAGICPVLKNELSFKLRVQKSYHQEVAQLLFLNLFKQEKLSDEVKQKLNNQNREFILDKDQDEIPLENPRIYWLSNYTNHPLTADVQTNEIANAKKLSVSQIRKMKFWTYTRKTRDSLGNESKDYLIMELDVHTNFLSTFRGENIKFSDVQGL